MRSIAFISEKGGTGKSTSVLNLAACLAQRALNVLVIDTDPQANATYVLLRGQKPTGPTLANVLLDQLEAQQAIIPTALDSVSLLPAETSLADTAMQLGQKVGRERRLRLAMETAEDAFDFVLIDTAPTRSIITTNVLNYARELLVPLAPGLFGVLGLGQLQSDVADVRRYLDNRTLRIAGIVLTMVERNRVAKDIDDQLRQHFGALVFTSKIPRTVKLEEAHSRHQTILTYAPGSTGAEAYQALAMEILDNGRPKEESDPSRRDSSTHNAA
jgi:chromosome partitioning protein